jgi:hypothetical protein
LDVIYKHWTGYNSVHSTIGTSRSIVNPSDIYSVWQKMSSLRSTIPRRCVKFKVGDLVRTTKERLKFAKLSEQTISKEIFRFVKAIQRIPQPVYELTDLRCRPTEGHFCNYELDKITISPETEFQIHKTVRTRKNGDSKQHLVKWKGYYHTFNSWVKACDIKRI